jgi:hypothetical protein
LMSFNTGNHSFGLGPNPGANYSYNGYGISSNLSTHGVSKSWEIWSYIQLEDILMDIRLVQLIRLKQIQDVK